MNIRAHTIEQKINRLPWLSTIVATALVLLAVITLGVSVVGAFNTSALRDLQRTNDCKSTITADDQRAANALVLAIADGIAINGVPTDEERAAYRTEVSAAAARLKVTQDRRAHINQLCSPSTKEQP